MSAARQPAIFIPHGGGPCFWMEFPPPFGPHAWDRLRDYLAGLVRAAGAAEGVSGRQRPLGGGGAHRQRQPEAGHAVRLLRLPRAHIRAQLSGAGRAGAWRGGQAADRGGGPAGRCRRQTRLDHGVFVPFLIVDPKAEIPVVMLSLRKDLDPAFHIRLGKALTPLRDQGVAIVGSGMSFMTCAISRMAIRKLRRPSTRGSTRPPRRRRLSARRGSRIGTGRRGLARAIRARNICCH